MKPRLIVLLENVRSAYNVGSVFRTCDSAGVDELILTGYTPYPPHNKLNKTALGSLDSVSWRRVESSIEAVHSLIENGVRVISMETTDEAISLYETPFSEDTCLVYGNEVFGVSPEVLALSRLVVKIPQFGVKESLNIATAVGVSVYEMVRKRLQLGC